jgi:hypothetical protein
MIQWFKISVSGGGAGVCIAGTEGGDRFGEVI